MYRWLVVCEESRNGSFKFEVGPHQFNLKMQHFSQFPYSAWKKNQKLAGLWLAGEVVDHIGIYGSKAAEGLSAFQRRSCFNFSCQQLIDECIVITISFLFSRIFSSRENVGSNPKVSTFFMPWFIQDRHHWVTRLNVLKVCVVPGGMNIVSSVACQRDKITPI